MSSITLVNMTPQYGVYLTIVIYNHKTFIVLATGIFYGRLFQVVPVQCSETRSGTV